IVVVPGVVVGVTTGVGVGVTTGVGVGQVPPPPSSSTVLTMVVDVSKPSATSTRPSVNVPCACPERLASRFGPALNELVAMVKIRVVLPGTKAPVEPLVIS